MSDLTLTYSGFATPPALPFDVGNVVTGIVVLSTAVGGGLLVLRLIFGL